MVIGLASAGGSSANKEQFLAVRVAVILGTLLLLTENRKIKELVDKGDFSSWTIDWKHFL